MAGETVARAAARHRPGETGNSLDLTDEGDDYSGGFSAIRSRLVDDRGVRYVDFVRGLHPSYPRVYRDIAFGYAGLAIVYALTLAAPSWGLPKVLAAALGAIGIGYGIAYLQLFIHEGAHYNLARAKARSDRICDLAISWMVGTTVALYRPVHFQHHRSLGMTDDSEFTYFYPLNPIFLLKALFGIRAAEVMLQRARSPGTQKQPRSGIPKALVAGMLVHAAIVIASLVVGWWWCALAWVVGVALVFPFCAALRQLLEHRDDTARPDSDFRTEAHGAFTRLFGDGAFAASFGGAGFNRHLLHHWEPQVSYTNLAELERFLQRTPVAAIMDRRRSTYGETFRRLISLH